MGPTLVTGATGVAGGALCRRLAGEGREVVAFVRAGSHSEALRALGIECRVVDLADPASVRAHFEPFDCIYHLAAAYRTEHADRDAFRRVNVVATRVLLDTAREAGAGRFVHCSTVGVQGEIEDPPADEDYRTKPTDHYQASKLEGERLARAAFAAGLPGVVVRPVGIYGPGDRRFLKLFRAVDRRVFVMIGSGRVLYHLTYIDDLVEGLVLAGTREAALGGVFTLAGPEATTLRELVDRVADVLGRPRPRWRVPFAPVYAAAVVCEALCRPLGVDPPLYRRRLEFFRHDRAFRTERARKALGYEPRISLREGLARTAASYREQGLL